MDKAVMHKQQPIVKVKFVHDELKVLPDGQSSDA